MFRTAFWSILYPQHCAPIHSPSDDGLQAPSVGASLSKQEPYNHFRQWWGMWQEAVQSDGDGTKLLLEVTPGAKHPVFPAGFNAWRGRICIKVRAQPQVGRANRAVIDAVSAIGPCEIIAGHADSRKTVRIDVPYEEVLAWLSERM